MFLTTVFAKNTFKRIRLAISMLPLLASLSPSASATAPVPAQVPLLATVGAGVPPNFMLTMDDSGSMAFRHMPETVFAGGTFATTNPAQSNTVLWSKLDTYQTGTNLIGTVPGNIASTNYVLRALRSSDTNTIYYNPETRYRPWLDSAGSRLPDSPVAKAYLNPAIRTGATGTFVDLTTTATVVGRTFVNANAMVNLVSYRIEATSTGGGATTNFRNYGAANNNVGTTFTKINGVATGSGVVSLNGTGTDPTGWCYAQDNNTTGYGTAYGNGCGPVGNFVGGYTFTHDPGVYFRLQKSSGAYLAVNAAANYLGYSINSAASTLYTKYPARDDCIAVAGSCNQIEERQNFANWFSYYRTRNLLARGSMMESFATVGNTLRIGFGRINLNPLPNPKLVDGVSTIVIESDVTKYGGGGVRAFTQARKDQLFKWLMDLPASGGTPLPAALDAIGTYYMRSDYRGPYTDDPSVITNIVADNKTCRRSFQLMVTDGYWNGTPPIVGNQDGTAGTTITDGGSFTFQADTRPFADGFENTLADVAMKYWKNDLQPGIVSPGIKNKIQKTNTLYGPSAYWQSMTNFMVGLGVKGNLNPDTDLAALTNGTKIWAKPSTSSVGNPANIDDLWHAAINSRGAYYSAKDPETLASAVKSALVTAQGGQGASAGVATISSVLEDGNRKYVPTYDANVWSGDISGQPLDSNGQAGVAAWTAAARVPVWTARDNYIYTWNRSLSGAVPFRWGSLGSAEQSEMTNGTSALVDYLKGDHSLEATVVAPLNPYRERKDSAGLPFVLGDFVDSNPVLVKGTFDGRYGALNLGGSSAYQIFTAAKKRRDAVLFVGGNDGMLHGFIDQNTTASAATDGREVFGYVPQAVYPNLYKLADKSYGGTVPHTFYVDGPQAESDAWVSGPAYPAFNGQPACASGTKCWRNYLLGSLGAGGRAVYALDVTSSPNLNAANIRWEISSVQDSDLGYVMAPIEVGVLPGGKWVAIFGNGYSSNHEDAVLFVVDLETAAITKLNVDNSGNNGLGGVGVVRDASGYITTLYAGDLKGQLWKFEYDAAASSNFKVSSQYPSGLMFVAKDSSSNRQAITQPPSIFDHTKGGKIIVFGTGQLFATADVSDKKTQTLYGVWDKVGATLTAPMSRNALFADRSLTTVAGTSFYKLTEPGMDWSEDGGVQRGWFMDLTPIDGGRFVYPTQILNPNIAASGTSKGLAGLVLATAVAPPQSAAVCDVGNGTSADLIAKVEPGTTAAAKAAVDAGDNSAKPIFDTSGDGYVTALDDASVIGISSNTVGRRAVVTGTGSTAGGGGGGGGSGMCPTGFHEISIQTATGQEKACLPDQQGGNRRFQRIQRRIINPPIR